VKLVRDEPETFALRTVLPRWPDRLTSVIGEVEVQRAAARGGVDALVVLSGISFVELSEPIRRLAGGVGSPSLRSLDAIHLASALSLGDDLGAFCCYDGQLRADAEAAGLNVLSPGLD
jgi:uncharacterized protein